MDLAELVAARRWSSLVDLLHELPKASRTWEAVLNDPELAAQIVAAKDREGHLDLGDDAEDFGDDDSPGWTPQYREYDLHAKQLGDIINVLAGLHQAVIATGGGKARRTDPYPVPKTALPEAEVDQARADGDAILDMLGMKDSLTP